MENALHGLSWYIVIGVLLIVLIGIPTWFLTRRRESKKRQNAKAGLARTSLAELQAQPVVLKLELHGLRKLLLSPSAVSWFEALLQRTFEERGSLEINYPLLAVKYAFLLEQFVERIRPWSDAWLVESPVVGVPKEFNPGEDFIILRPTRPGFERPTWVRLKATDSQWQSHFAGFAETVEWIAEQAAEEALLASQVEEMNVPEWDAEFLKAQCSPIMNGFVRSWIMLTSVHGLSVKSEIARISQAGTRKSIPGNA